MLGDLATLSRVLAYRSTPFGRPGQDGPGMPGAVARAISRFEAGLERNVVLEALNDYLLALRFVLEGGGPADLGLAMRVAALCAEPERRSETKAIVDRALALERELWSGEPAPAAEGAPTAAETAVAIEELTRAILRDAACGHLGGDLRSTADEILLADGLAVGEGEAEQRGGSEEWDLPHDEQDELDEREDDVDEPSRSDVEEAQDDLEEPSRSDPGGEQPHVEEPTGRLRDQLWMDVSDEWQEGDEAQRRRRGRCRSRSPRVESGSSHAPSRRRRTCSPAARHGREERPPTAIDARRARADDRVAELLDERPPRAPARWPTASPISSRVPRPPSGTCASSATTAAGAPSRRPSVEFPELASSSDHPGRVPGLGP